MAKTRMLSKTVGCSQPDHKRIRSQDCCRLRVALEELEIEYVFVALLETTWKRSRTREDAGDVNQRRHPGHCVDVNKDNVEGIFERDQWAK